MVGVQMRDDGGADVLARQADGAQAEPQLVLTRDSVEREGRVLDVHGLAHVDQDALVAVLDEPGAGRHRLRPAAGEEEIEASPEPGPGMHE